jgi:hypothetical protein
LADNGEIPENKLKEAVKKLGIDPEKLNPVEV